jgi:hypothetical protein
MEWIILVYLFWFEEFNQWTNWSLVQFPRRKFTDKKNGPKVEDLFRPYPSFGFVRPFVRPSHLSFFRPTNRPSVRHMIRPSNKASVRPTNRSSIRQIVRPSDKSFVRCACKKKVTTVPLVCVSRALSVVRLFCLLVAIVASALAPMDY